MTREVYIRSKGKNFSTEMVIKHWNRLPEVVVEYHLPGVISKMCRCGTEMV